MKLALFGARGTIGQRIAAEAKSRGHQVTPLGRREADATDVVSVARAVQGHDAVISAVGPGHGPRAQPADMLKTSARALLAGLKRAGVKRLIVVGGAGSLDIAPGRQLVDQPDFPPAWRPQALAHRDALGIFRGNQDIDWTYVSPAAQLEPGQRTGKYRVGGDRLLVDDKGDSRISAEDLAVALLDELEQPRHVRKRFTVAS
jgi:putative NADH-flavin reductase